MLRTPAQGGLRFEHLPERYRERQWITVTQNTQAWGKALFHFTEMWKQLGYSDDDFVRARARGASEEDQR